MSEYMRPIRMPLVISSTKKPRSSAMDGHPLDVLDVDRGPQRPLAAILVGDGRRQLDGGAARIERVGDRRVLLGDVAAPDLARTRHLGVVGLQVLGQQQEAAD